MTKVSLTIPWKVSLHGGHSGEFCNHAKGTLREMIEAALDQKMPMFGMTEHSPRYEDRHLFDEEKAQGWNADVLIDVFESYSSEARKLQEEYGGRIELLRGFETEFVDESYIEKMRDLKVTGQFDYVVGSVHHVKGICIDTFSEWFKKALRKCGGLENLAIEYYRSIQTMVQEIKPEVVGHIDLIRKLGDDFGSLDTPRIRAQMNDTLAAVKIAGSILDLNVYPLRKGKPHPYPAPWIVEMARDMGIGFCFGDDSHSPDTVGVGIESGRNYLLSMGVASITALTKADGTPEKITISLNQ